MGPTKKYLSIINLFIVRGDKIVENENDIIIIDKKFHISKLLKKYNKNGIHRLLNYCIRIYENKFLHIHKSINGENNGI